MTYVTTMERRGIKKGIEKGIEKGEQQGEAKTLLKILNKRFGSVPVATESKIRAASVEQIEAWIDLSLDATTMQQVFSA